MLDPRPHDVVVIGGGIFGCATAWSLTQAGVGRVLLLERHELAQASTSRAAALLTRVRTRPGQSALVAWTRRAIPMLEQQLGEELALCVPGSLHVAAQESSVKALEELVEVAQDIEEPVRWISPDEANQRAPWLETGECLRVAFMPEDSHIDPYLLATSYARAARAGGAQVRTGVEVEGLLYSGTRVTGVSTSAGDIHCGAVALCGGPWAGILARQAGWQLPMAAVRSHYWITTVGDLYPADSPFVVLPDAGAYARPELGGLLFGLRDSLSPARAPEQLPEDLQQLRFEEDPEGWEALAECGPGLARFFPALEEAPLAHYVAGPSTYTPDGQFVIGALPGVEGLYVASGCNGGGIAISGGVGQALTDLCLGRDPALDLSPFRLDRFGPVESSSRAWLRRCADARTRKRSG